MRDKPVHRGASLLRSLLTHSALGFFFLLVKRTKGLREFEKGQIPHITITGMDILLCCLSLFLIIKLRAEKLSTLFKFFSISKIRRILIPVQDCENKVNIYSAPSNICIYLPKTYHYSVSVNSCP